MATTKEATVIILDVGQSTSSKAPDRAKSKSFFENAKQCIDRILQRKIFSQPKDEVALVLMGTNGTSNNLNSTLDGYEHIITAIDLEMTNWDMLAVLEREVEASASEGDWLDALIVAMDVIKMHSAKKFKTFKIVLLSPFLAPVQGEHVSEVIDQLTAMDIELIVISDHIEYVADADDTDELNETAMFSQKVKTTQHQDKSRELVTDIISKTDGVLCSFDQALVQLIYFEKKKQRSMPWKVDLQIGSELKIKVSAYINVKDCSAFTWKTGAEDDQVCLYRTDYLLNDKQLGEEVYSHLIRGYMYGDTAVAFDSKLRPLNAAGNEKSLMCLGFTSQSLIRDEFSAGTGIWSVVAQPEFTTSESMFAHLVATMKAMNVALVARYLYRAGLKPKVVALFPVESKVPYKNSASLNMMELIYKENMNEMIVPSLRSHKTEPTAEQIEAVDALIDAMNLMDVSEDQENVEAFANNKILNPATQHMYRVITHRALYPTRPIPMVDADLNERLDVPAKLKANSAPIVQQLKTLFPLEKIDKATKEKFFDRIKKIASSGNDDIAPVDPDALTQADDASADNSTICEVGSKTPAEDFGELLRRGEKFSVLCQQIQVVITDLVLKAVVVQMRKVAMAIMVYREEARLIGAFRYNEWIVEFKRILLSRKKMDVWQDIVVKEGFGLITAAEAESSTVTDKEAIEFYELGGGSGTRVAGQDEAEAEDDIDDLIGNM